MKTRTVIYADSGMVLTNGTTYGRQIFLAEGESADSYREITDSEYEKIREKEREAQENENIH